MADTANSISTASDYPYVIAESVFIKVPDRSLSCSCVIFAKDYLGITETLGTAKYIRPNTKTPTVNSLILLNEGILGHVGVVLDIHNGKVWFVESNYKKCEITYRELDITDKRIRGYWKP